MFETQRELVAAVVTHKHLTTFALPIASRIDTVTQLRAVAFEPFHAVLLITLVANRLFSIPFISQQSVLNQPRALPPSSCKVLVSDYTCHRTI